MQARTDFAVVANRLPVRRVQREGRSVWRTSPGGLVSALMPVLRRRNGEWVGWAGVPGEAPAPFEAEGIRNRPVGLAPVEVAAFYDGFCNRTLWPLYHDALREPRYRRQWWGPYVEANQRFADVVAQSVGPAGTVWVHDYHLQLVPGMLREMRPDLRTGFFMHIPFPPTELFSRLPWRRAILEGLLGADVVGFQTALAARNFQNLCKRICGATGGGGELRYRGRRVRVGAFPVSIDAERFAELASRPDVIRRSEEFRRRVGGRRVILGVDRLDYTKGIDLRLRAFREVLRSGRARPNECVFVQVAVPSRERVAEYRALRSKVERIVGEVNGEYGDIGMPVVHYVRREYPQEVLVALYMAADVMAVTPLRDGMNLVAKEFCATRLHDTGVLVLSEFTGAATQLRSALLVNPYDIDGLAAAIGTGLTMPPQDQRRRMRELRRSVRRNTVFDWAESFLGALAGEAVPHSVAGR